MGSMREKWIGCINNMEVKRWIWVYWLWVRQMGYCESEMLMLYLKCVDSTIWLCFFVRALLRCLQHCAVNGSPKMAKHAVICISTVFASTQRAAFEQLHKVHSLSHLFFVHYGLYNSVIRNLIILIIIIWLSSSINPNYNYRVFVIGSYIGNFFVILCTFSSNSELKYMHVAQNINFNIRFSSVVHSSQIIDMHYALSFDLPLLWIMVLWSCMQFLAAYSVTLHSVRF